MRRKQIILEKPYLEKDGDSVKLCAEVTYHRKKQVLYFSVEQEYGKYLVEDRLDAFLISFLTVAMREQADIVCKAPISRRLFYQLVHYLIPIMSSTMEVFHPIKIISEPTDVPIEIGDAVATGWTGGVDSLYTVMNHLKSKDPHHKLTHLMITSNGSLEEEDNTATLKKLVSMARKGIAKDTNLKVVSIDTNIQNIVEEHFLSVVSIRLVAVVLALQKLFHIFYISATYDLGHFAFVPENMGYYEMVLLNHLQTDYTIFYSSGCESTRMQKLKELSQYELAHRYLHPCIRVGGKNCGICGKCVRTMSTLYGLGTLEQFSNVFDVEYFKKNLDWYFAQLLAHHTSQHYQEALLTLRKAGIMPSERAIRMGKVIEKAQKVVTDNRELLLKKMESKN